MFQVGNVHHVAKLLITATLRLPGELGKDADLNVGEVTEILVVDVLSEFRKLGEC